MRGVRVTIFLGICLLAGTGCGRTNDEIKTRFSQKIQGFSPQWRDINVTDDNDAGVTIKASYYGGNGRHDFTVDYLRKYSLISAWCGEKQKMTYYYAGKNGEPVISSDNADILPSDRPLVHSLLKDLIRAMHWAAK